MGLPRYRAGDAEVLAEGRACVLPPDQAARTWMDRYIDYMATKRGMADALRVVIASGGTPYAQSRDRLLTAIATLLKAGNEAGTLRADVPPGVIGARFHRAVADLIVDLASACDTGSQPVALSGGVFQNAVLRRLAVNGLRAKGFDVITHRRVPPNDGGLALGQLLVGNAQ